MIRYIYASIIFVVHNRKSNATTIYLGMAEVGTILPLASWESLASYCGLILWKDIGLTILQMKGGFLLKLSPGLEILNFNTDNKTASVSVFAKM